MRASKYRAILTVAYAAGLRVSEVARLKTADIDSQRGVIRVEEEGGSGLNIRCCLHEARELGRSLRSSTGTNIRA